MICDPCKQAGKRTSAAHDHSDEEFARELFDRAMHLHAKCVNYKRQDPRGTWCACQHKLQGVNWLVVG